MDMLTRRESNPEIPLTVPNLISVMSRGICVSMILALLFAYFLFYLLLLHVSDFPCPSIVRFIILGCIPSYLFGTFLLKNTRHRRHFFNKVILYTFLFYAYARFYFLSSHLLLKLTYCLYLARAAI
jgi:hypothetical protein